MVNFFGRQKFLSVFEKFCKGVWLRVLSLGVTSPHIIPVQLENQLCSLRFSTCTYPQQGNFHEEHYKELGQLVISLWFWRQHIYTQSKKEGEKKKEQVVLSMLCLGVTVSVSVMSICALWSFCVFVFTLLLFHRFLYFLFNI